MAAIADPPVRTAACAGISSSPPVACLLAVEGAHTCALWAGTRCGLRLLLLHQRWGSPCDPIGRAVAHLGAARAGLRHPAHPARPGDEVSCDQRSGRRLLPVRGLLATAVVGPSVIPRITPELYLLHRSAGLAFLLPSCRSPLNFSRCAGSPQSALARSISTRAGGFRNGSWPDSADIKTPARGAIVGSSSWWPRHRCSSAPRSLVPVPAEVVLIPVRPHVQADVPRFAHSPNYEQTVASLSSTAPLVGPFVGVA